MAYKKFSTTKATALAAAASASATSIEVVDGSSYPDPALGGNGPYTLLLAYGSDREEIVTVTAKPSANTLTVTRGQDGSAATTKNIGDIVVHGVSKRDWEDVQTAVDSLSSQVGTLNSAMSTKAPLASPTLTGDPKAPTPAAGDNDTSIATTAFVQQQVLIGTIAMWGGTAVPTGWHLCDGSAHGSSALQTVLGSANAPDLRNRFIVGAGAAYARGSTGGADTVTLTEAQSGLRSHDHTGSSVAETQEHTHSGTTASDNTDHTHSGTTAGMNRNSVHQHSAYILENTTATGTNPWYLRMGSNVADVINRTAVRMDDANTSHEHTFDTQGRSAYHQHDFGTGGRSAAHTHGVVINAVTGANATAAHENRPPYYALSFIIKKA